NSPDETKTQTEKDFNIGFAKQIGDIGLIVRWILFAVFFTLLLVVGNTMAQSVRERVPELAVLKTLGFSDASVLGFVLAEAVAVFTALLAMATGFESTLKANGRNDAAIVMRGGSDSELNSGLARDDTILIKQAPGIRKGADGLPLASAEVMVIAELVRKGDKA